VPSKKNKEHYFKQFPEIFQKLVITIPFREALQQMPHGGHGEWKLRVECG